MSISNVLKVGGHTPSNSVKNNLPSGDNLHFKRSGQVDVRQEGNIDVIDVSAAAVNHDNIFQCLIILLSNVLFATTMRSILLQPLL